MTLQVLHVEDDRVDAEAFRRALEEVDIDVDLHLARDGEEGLRMLRDGSVERPRVVVLDIRMPRMDGLAFLEELRADADLTATPVFVLTSSTNEHDKRAAYRHHVAGYFVKPFEPDGLEEVVARLARYWARMELPGHGPAGGTPQG